MKTYRLTLTFTDPSSVEIEELGEIKSKLKPETQAAAAMELLEALFVKLTLEKKRGRQ